MEYTVGFGASPISQATGLRRTYAAIHASASAEYRMQIRRRSMWLVLGLIGAYMLWVLTHQAPATGTTAVQAAEWTWLLQVFMPIAFGVLLADRFPRDRKLGVDELLDSSPARFEARLIGKYLGATAATLVPIVITDALGLAWIATRGPDPVTALTVGVPAFVLIDLPGLLFVAGFSVCCPLIMPVPVYQFLFVGYWFWGNLMPPQIMPSLRDTWLAPIGWMAGGGLFGIFNGNPGSPAATPFDAFMSISLLLGGALAALLAGLTVMRLERGRR